MLKADVIVVGAGPAGATAAALLAQDGVEVLLVDKAIFPRDKVCGDGVAARSLTVLERLGLGNWIAGKGFLEPEVMLLSSPGREWAHHTAPRQEGFSYGRVIPRRELDTTLVEQAQQMGARLLEGVQATALEQDSGGWLRVSGTSNNHPWTAQARLVIAADGALVPFTRHLGLVRRPPDMWAVRGYFAGAAGPEEQLEIHYEPGIHPGYGWIFPLGGGRVNVGVGAFASLLRERRWSLRELLRRFMEENPWARERLRDVHPLGPVRGFPLRTGVGGTVPYAEGVLVAGEAASLVHPLTGEGIYSALESGELAAQHARRALEQGDFSSRALAAYGRDLQRRFGGEHRAARIVRRLLSIPWVVNRVVRRARQDVDFALLLGYVIIGLRSPAALLRPGPIIKVLTTR